VLAGKGAIRAKSSMQGHRTMGNPLTKGRGKVFEGVIRKDGSVLSNWGAQEIGKRSAGIFTRYIPEEKKRRTRKRSGKKKRIHKA